MSLTKQDITGTPMDGVSYFPNSLDNSLIASCTLKSIASLSTLGTYSGTATGSLVFDADKGVQLTSTSRMTWLTSIAGLTDSYLSFELEHRGFQSCLTGYNNSSNPIQEARGTGQEHFVLLRNAATGSETSTVRLLYQFGVAGTGGNCNFLIYTNSPPGGYNYTPWVFRVSTEASTKDRASSDGSVIYSKVVMSFDSVANVISVYVNGRLFKAYTVYGTVDYANVMKNISLNNGDGSGLGLGAANVTVYNNTNFWIRNLEVHNTKYVPYVHDAAYRTFPDVVLFGGIDSFTATATDSTTEGAAAYEAKRILEFVHGRKTTVLSGLGIIGQDYDEVTNANIDAIIAQNPTVGWLSPTVNSLNSTAGWATTGGQAGWITEVNRVVNRLGNAPTLRTLILFPTWNYLNCAASAGFGGTNVNAEAAWSDTTITDFMNNYFATMASNTSIDRNVRNKIVYFDISTATGGDVKAKNYHRRYTGASAVWGYNGGAQGLIGSIDTTDVHPTLPYHLEVGKILAGLINKTY